MYYLEKDFEDFIIARCERALEDNEEYMRLEQSGEVSQDKLQSMAEVLCYKQCFKDMMAIQKL
jgi:hypothetical protein